MAGSMRTFVTDRLTDRLTDGAGLLRTRERVLKKETWPNIGPNMPMAKIEVFGCLLDPNAFKFADIAHFDQAE